MGFIITQHVDVGAIKTGVATVVDNLDRHIAVLEAWANTIDDPERKKAVLTTVENLKKLRGEIEVPLFEITECDNLI